MGRQGEEECVGGESLGHQVEVVKAGKSAGGCFPGALGAGLSSAGPSGICQTLVLDLVHLQVCGRGPILPAAQGIHGNRAAEWAGALSVQPQAEALLAEHMLWGQQQE